EVRNLTHLTSPHDFTNPLLYGLWPFAISHLPSAISLSLHDFTNQQLYDFMCWLSAICYQPSASSLSLHDFTNQQLYKKMRLSKKPFFKKESPIRESVGDFYCLS